MYMYGTITISWDRTFGLGAEDSQQRYMPVMLRPVGMAHEDMLEELYVRLLDAFPDVCVTWQGLAPFPLDDLYVEGFDAEMNAAQLEGSPDFD